MRPIEQIEADLAALEAENQDLGRQQDAIRDARSAIRARMDALVRERHAAHREMSQRGGVVAPGAVVESSGGKA